MSSVLKLIHENEMTRALLDNDGDLKKLFEIEVEVKAVIERMEKGKATADDSAAGTQLIGLMARLLAKIEKLGGGAKGKDEHAKQKQQMARWLERNMSDVNMVLKDKKSKHNGNMVKWLTAYRKLLKAERIKDTQQALDEVALVLKAYAKDFKLSEKQRQDIKKRIEGVKQKMLKEVDKMNKIKAKIGAAFFKKEP